MKQVVQTQLKEIVDVATGEVLQYESTKTYKEKVDSEKFYMVFFDHFHSFPSLKRSAINNNVLSELCKLAEFNTGIIHMTPKTRLDVCELLDISKSQLCNALKALRDDDLISADKGDYKLNPEIFWKGDQRIRKEELLKNKELKITYELVDAE